MIVLNFAHPLSLSQQQEIERRTGKKIDQLYEQHLHFKAGESFARQACDAVEAIGLTAEAWQQDDILFAPPSFSAIAAVMLAELHGRMGYFPNCLRLRIEDVRGMPRFKIAEIITLQEVRDKARAWRAESQERMSHDARVILSDGNDHKRRKTNA